MTETIPSAIAASEAAGHELDARDLKVLGMASIGWTYKEIGKELGVSEHAVKMRAKRLFNKLGADNITNAVAMALRRGLIT